MKEHILIRAILWVTFYGDFLIVFTSVLFLSSCVDGTERQDSSISVLRLLNCEN